MTDTAQDPKQIIATGEEGSDVWNCAFGTWSDDDFGIDSDETIGKGERLYVRRDLYDAELRRAEEGSRKIAQLEARDYIQCGVIDRNLQSMGRSDEEIARLTAALATARNDALDEAAKACALEIALSDCPILDDWSEGVEDAMNAIAALKTTPE